MTGASLRSIYTDLLLEEYLELEEFVARAQTGEFGDFSRDDIVAFLREMELDVMSNIETQLAAHPHWEPMKEQAAANVQRRIQELADDLQER